jgi:FHS family glucose/mannose:H+ symporter-like MFS transporter
MKQEAPADRLPCARRFGAVIAIYGSGLLLGISLVSIPASSTVITASHGFNSNQYGSLFLPQLACALVGGISAGLFGSRIGIHRLLLIAIASLGFAVLLMAGSANASAQSAYRLLMAAMGFVGLGIGIGGGPLNAFPALLFPNMRNTAVTAIHVVVGIGMMLSPLYHSSFANAGHWALGLIFLGSLAGALFFLAVPMAVHPAPTDDAADGLTRHPAASLFMWLLIANATIYSVAEGIFSNWAMLYLQTSKELDISAASLSLTAFLALLTLGRVIASLLVIRIRPIAFLIALPMGIMASFLLIPEIDGPGSAIVIFGFAGLACSAYFPMLIAYASTGFPAHLAWIATMMISAQMVGVGLGTYVIGRLAQNIPFATLYHVSAIYPAALLMLLYIAFRLGRGAKSANSSHGVRAS